MQPTRTEVRGRLNTLVDDLVAVCATQTCDATRTVAIVKGACASVLGSAAVTLH